MLKGFMAKIIRSVTAAFVAGILVLPGAALASTYGSSSYNNCNYNGVGCTTTTTTTTTPTTTTKTSAAATTETTPATTTTTPAASGTIVNLDPFTAFNDGSGKVTEVTKGAVFEFSLIVDGATTQTSSSGTVTVRPTQTTEKHTITLDSVTQDTVLITVASTPKQYTLRLNQPIEIDANGDGQKDIGIEVTSITPPTATLKVWKLTAPGAIASTIKTPIVVADQRSATASLIGILAIIGAILLLPRRAFRVIAKLWGIRPGLGRRVIETRGKTGSLSDHLPTDIPSHHNPIMPAHDLHSQAGVLINDEETVNEATPVSEQKKIIVKDHKK